MKYSKGQTVLANDGSQVRKGVVSAVTTDGRYWIEFTGKTGVNSYRNLNTESQISEYTEVVETQEATQEVKIDDTIIVFTTSVRSGKETVKSVSGAFIREDNNSFTLKVKGKNKKFNKGVDARHIEGFKVFQA